MNAVIYARYSSMNQTEQSIEGQLRDNYAWAKQNNVTVIGEYIDRALTGTKDARPDFQRMISDAESRKFELVIVWKLDRFARNRYDSAVYKAKLKKCGVKVVSVMENITDNPEGIILEGLLEAMAEYYSANLSQNTIRGKRETAAKGNWNGGHPPFGYKIVDKKLVPDEKRVPIVKYIFDQYANGVSKKDLIHELDQKGVRTYYGRPLTYASFNSVLRNPAYIGKCMYKGQVVEGLSEPIIEERTFYKVQEQIKKRAHAPAANKATVSYLLSGKVFCGTCGSPMVGTVGTSHSGNRYYYYMCSHRKHPFRCKKKNEKKDFLEQFVVDQTLKYILSPSHIKKIAQAVVENYKKEFSNDEVQRLKNAIRSLDNEMEKLIDVMMDTPKAARKAISDRMESLGLQKDDLEISLQKLEAASRIPLNEAEVIAWLKTFQDGDSKDQEFCQRIIDIFVNCVYVYDDRIVIFYNIRGGGQKKLSFSEVKNASGTKPEAGEGCSDLNTFADARVIKSEPDHWYVFISGMLGLVVER